MVSLHHGYDYLYESEEDVDKVESDDEVDIEEEEEEKEDTMSISSTSTKYKYDIITNVIKLAIQNLLENEEITFGNLTKDINDYIPVKLPI